MEQKHSLFCPLACVEATTNKIKPSEHSHTVMNDIPLFRLQCFVRKRIMYPFMNQPPHYPMFIRPFFAQEKKCQFQTIR